MKKPKLYCLLSSFVLILLINTAQADFIWLVKPPGIENDPNAKEGIIDYQIPPWWGELPNHENPNFPTFLYTPCDEKNKVQELRLNFTYLQDYNNPILNIAVIKPYVNDPNNPYSLAVHKDNIIQVCDPKKIDRTGNYGFPLGYIKKGLHEQNSIIIRVSGLYRIELDILSLSLDDDDSDGDGVSDIDEGEAYQGNNRVVNIPIKSYDPDPLIPKSIILQIEEETPYFRQVSFLDPNAIELPVWLKSDLFLPFDILGFKIEEIASQGRINITFRYSCTIYSSIDFYTYQDTNVWQETAHEFLDGYTARITLNDGGPGDFDGVKDGIIKTRLIPTYPKELDIHLQKGNCFISALLWGKENEAEL